MSDRVGAERIELRPKHRTIRNPGTEPVRENRTERDQILTALRAHRGNQSEAARSLGGMKRTTLLYKMKRLDIRPEEYG